MKKLIYLGAAVALTTAVAYPVMYPPFWVKSGIRSSLAEYARDPDSLQITNLRYSDLNGDIVCGLINAKNGFGAYTGNKVFAYSRQQNFTFLQGVDPSADAMIDMFKCG